jgi:hypothetical protein
VAYADWIDLTVPLLMRCIGQSQTGGPAKLGKRTSGAVEATWSKVLNDQVLGRHVHTVLSKAFNIGQFGNRQGNSDGLKTTWLNVWKTTLTIPRAFDSFRADRDSSHLGGRVCDDAHADAPTSAKERAGEEC